MTDSRSVTLPTRWPGTPPDWRASWGPAPRWATPRSLDRPTYGGTLARIGRELGLPPIPRQAGKTTLKIPLYVHRMGALELAELWMTAQSGGKALDRWNKARQWMERRGSPVREYVKSWTSIAHEMIMWKPTGSILRPFTPNDESMHGESPELVDVDEWWAFDAVAAEELTGAYSPGFLTKNAQAWKTSTRGKSWSHGLNEDVKKGRAAVEMGRRAGTAYFEWSLPAQLQGVNLTELPDEVLVA